MIPSPKQISTPTPDIASNASISMFANMFYLVSRLILPPMILAHVSLAEYGLWSACCVLLMYIGLTDAGFSNVYVRYTARYHAQGDTDSINKLLSTGVLTLSAVALVLLCAIWFVIPHLLSLLNVSVDQQQTATYLIMGTATMYLLDISLGAYCYLLHGLQRIREEKRIAIIGYILEPLLILLFLQLGAGVYSLLFAFILRYCWSLSSFIRLAHQFIPELKVRFAFFDKTMLKLFLGFGTKVQLSALLGTFLFSLDRIIVGMMMGPKGIALFELGTKLPVSANSIPATISNVTYPAAARYLTQNDTDAVKRLYVQSSRAICFLSGLPLAFMALFSGAIIHVWLGNKDGIEQVPTILALTAIWCHLHITTGPGTAVFRAMGHVGNEFFYHILRLSCIAIAVLVSMQWLGVTLYALIIGLASGNATASISYLVHNQRRLALPLTSLLRDILLPGALAYPVAVVTQQLWSFVLPYQLTRGEMLFVILLIGALYTALWFITAWQFMHTHERDWILSKLARFSSLIPRGKKV